MEGSCRVGLRVGDVPAAMRFSGGLGQRLFGRLASLGESPSASSSAALTA
jgi:hypothetical protein